MIATDASVRRTIGRIDAIEAWRAVAVTWVVLFHYLLVRDAATADPWVAAASASWLANAAIRNGYLGVDLFFLITGFLLVLPWVRNAAQGVPSPSTADFHRRRVRRIVPAYYVHLAFLFGICAPVLLGTAWLREERSLVAINLAAHLSFMHYMTPVTSASLNLNGALWTLALEAQFYLLLPLLAPAFVRRPIACAAAMFAIAAAWRWAAAHDLALLVRWEMALGARWNLAEAVIRHLLATQLPAYLGHFAAGMLLGMAWWRTHAASSGTAHTVVRIITAALAIVLLGWAYAGGGGAVMGPMGSWLATLAAFVSLMAASTLGAGEGRLPRAMAPLLFVGRVSYSIYLYHLPLLLLWNRFRILDGSPWSLPAWLAVVLLAGWASYSWVERPFLRPRARPDAMHRAL